MVVVYTNSVPICTTYTNLGHFFKVADLKPSELYINFWDNYAIKHHMLNKLDKETGMKKMYETIEDFEDIVSHTGVNHKKFLYTDSSNRLLKDKEFYSLFEEISSKITMWDVMKEYEKGKSIEYLDLTLSNIFNIIVDYLTCVFIENLYPDKKLKRPDIYFTSERFRPFFPIIEEVIKKEYPLVQLPSPAYISFPFILCPAIKQLPTLGMTREEIERIIQNYINSKKLKNEEIDELIKVFSHTLESFSYGKAKLTAEQFAMKLKICTDEEVVKYLSLAFVEYFDSISNIIERRRNDFQESLVIEDINEYTKKIRPLNRHKVRILKLCNGNNSVNDIANILKLNKNTAAIYITQLRKSKMITNESYPKRISDSITLNLKEIG